MPRHEDWPTRLHDAFVESQHKPFAWGSHDCMAFVFAMIHAQTGVDHYADYRGTYSSELGAAKVIKTAGGESVIDLVEDWAEKNDVKEIHPTFAQRGDLVQFDSPDGPVFAIVHHNGVHSVGVGKGGLMRLQTISAKRSWRV